MNECVIWGIIIMLGTWITQDALASIAFYPNESWRWNHIARVIRVIIGIALMVVGLMGLL